MAQAQAQAREVGGGAAAGHGTCFARSSAWPPNSLEWRRPAIEKLDPKAKRQITQLLDTFIERSKLKQRAQTWGQV